ncbi:MAG: hypothetical protein WBD86_00090 [Microgenomates group bacterium]
MTAEGVFPAVIAGVDVDKQPEVIRREDLFAVEEIMRIQESVFELLRDVTLKQEPNDSGESRPELFELILEQAKLLYDVWLRKRQDIERSKKNTFPDISWDKRKDWFHLEEPDDKRSKIITEEERSHSSLDYRRIKIHNYRYKPMGNALIEERMIWPSVGILTSSLETVVSGSLGGKLIFRTAGIKEGLWQNISLEFRISGKDNRIISVSGDEMLGVPQEGSDSPKITTEFKLLNIKR